MQCKACFLAAGRFKSLVGFETLGKKKERLKKQNKKEIHAQ